MKSHRNCGGFFVDSALIVCYLNDTGFVFSAASHLLIPNYSDVAYKNHIYFRITDKLNKLFLL